MTVQPIVLYPDDRLTTPCVEVTDFEAPEFKELVDDLLETAKANRAQGLAANQIGGNLKVFVTQVDGRAYKVFVNPQLELDGDIVRNNEGCLSFPGATVGVDRPEECTVVAQDETGTAFTLCVDDLESVAIQHENDHLEGRVVLEHLTRLEKRMFMKKINKYKKKYLSRV